jgi:hypothetical protein
VLRRARLLLCLLVASLFVTATVHAQEISLSSMIDCSGVVHSNGDADQSKGDADKAVPHHHGSCQGPSAFAPIITSGDLPIALAAPAAPEHATTAIHRWSTGPGLRPPIA